MGLQYASAADIAAFEAARTLYGNDSTQSNITSPVPKNGLLGNATQRAGGDVCVLLCREGTHLPEQILLSELAPSRDNCTARPCSAGYVVDAMQRKCTPGCMNGTVFISSELVAPQDKFALPFINGSLTGSESDGFCTPSCPEYLVANDSNGLAVCSRRCNENQRYDPTNGTCTESQCPAG